MRVLGVDFGFKRIGLAVGESALALAARPTLTASGGLKKDAAALHVIAEREQVEAIVLGVPLGNESDRQARICRTLASHLRELGWTVHEVDESLSTKEASQRMDTSGWTAAQHKRTIDARSALIILERFFHEQH